MNSPIDVCRHTDAASCGLWVRIHVGLFYTTIRYMLIHNPCTLTVHPFGWAVFCLQIVYRKAVRFSRYPVRIKAKE